jgi:hypothetical protein
VLDVNDHAPVTVSGHAPGAVNGDTVDLWCVHGTTDDYRFTSGVPVDGATDAFSADVPPDALLHATCRLLAIRAASTPPARTSRRTRAR